MKNVLITGSGGLIGSEAVKFYCKKGYQVTGIDNNMRQYFFGKEGDTSWNVELLKKQFSSLYKHLSLDLRDEASMEELFRKNKFDLIIHCAAQPSHDWAAKEPKTDFSVNALATLILLENVRIHNPEAVFIYTSTNKVYGDTPNTLPLIEKETRFELPEDHKYYNGIDESMSVDNSKHSLFGASKLAADILVQEYGKYFGLKTGVFRGGCLTGPAHSSVQLHGFLAYLVKSIVTEKEYTIFGYKGKQVRDNIHSFDLVNALDHFFKSPRPGEAYNIGGSRKSNTSMKEAIEKIEKLSGKKAKIKYSEEARIGDHIWYISDVSKFRKHYPSWEYTYDGDRILKDIYQGVVDSLNPQR
jgi:CDP-paratose 2-epimerase